MSQLPNLQPIRVNTYRLPAKDIAELRQAQRELHSHLPAIQALADCGYDCQSLQDAAIELDQRITLLLTHFSGRGSPMELPNEPSGST